MVKTEWVLYINPAAGGGKAIKSKSVIEKTLRNQGVSFTTVISKSKGDVNDLIHNEIIKGKRYFIIAGGDGTVNEVINAVMKQSFVNSESITITQLAVGTGNDWRRTWNLPKKLENQAKLILEGKTAFQDIGKITFREDSSIGPVWFLNVAGSGFDAQVTFAANEEKKRGKSGTLTYIKHLIGTLISFKAPEFKISYDGKTEFFKGFTVLVGICKFAGNKMKLVPHANPQDGMLSVVLVRKISKLKVILRLPMLFTGTFTKLKEVEIFDCDKIKIESEPKFFVQVDGESKGTSPIELEIQTSRISIIVP